jgi:hypothetical protein
MAPVLFVNCFLSQSIAHDTALLPHGGAGLFNQPYIQHLVKSQGLRAEWGVLIVAINSLH